MQKKISFIALLFYACISNAQIKLTGTVTDSARKPVVAASVTLIKSNNDAIIAYSITNNAGLYNLQYNGNATDTFYIQVNALGFALQKKKVIQANDNISFILKAAATVLPNVTVKNNLPFLKLKGDTLSYSVDSFKNEQDRTIGDVLRKMPGIDVDGNGKISYNGKAISNFYIDGDNLLDDRYNLATNSIAADMVDKVQVLENHQPIKVLKNVTVSDKVALNLSLKDKARLKISGRAEIGEGGSNNNNYDATINIMSFKRRYKAINSLKANNTGTDLADDLTSHNIMDYLKLLDNDVPSNLLSVSSAGALNISKQRYLFNNAGIINTNNLFKTKNDLQIRTNIYYLYDKQLQDYNNSTFYYLQGDTIKYFEQQHKESLFNNLRAQISINDNKQKHYLNNIVIAEVNKRPTSANVMANGALLNQHLSQRITNFSNELNFIKNIRNKIIAEGYSYINYFKQPETLNITPGISSNIFNSNSAYQQLTQTANVPTLFTNTYLQIRKSSQHLLQAYKTGFTTQWQELNSNINITQNDNSINKMVDSFSNHLSWQHYKIYTEAGYDLISNRIKLSLALPFAYQYIHYTDSILKINQFISKVLFTPSLQLKYATGTENFITTGYKYTNRQSTIEDIFGGYILKNYRLLNNNEIPFTESSIHSFSAGFNYRKTIKIFFFNILATYNIANNNNITATSFYQTIQKQSTIPYNNIYNSASIMAGVSKYLFAIHSTIAFKTSFKKNKSNQLQNTLLLQYNTFTENYSASISSKINSIINTAYNISYTNYNSECINITQPVQKTQLMQQSLELNIVPSQNFFIKFKAEDYYLKQHQLQTNTHYLFADASLLFKANKLRTDFSLEVFNIANTKQYSSIYLSGNNLSQNNYNIRPRMLLIKAAFNF
jgi:hypothetical protein